MKPGIVAAVFVSVLLVGGAFWTRISNAERPAPTLAAVEQIRTNEDFHENMYREIFLNPPQDAVSDKPTTGTDLVGRQLIMDYIDLESGGQANNMNLDLLAERYANSIPTLINSPKISYLDIKTVSNNAESLKKYSDALASIYTDQASKIGGLNFNNINYDNLPNSDYLTAVGRMESIYKETSASLTNLVVPFVMITLHVELTNSSLSNAAAMTAMREMSNDPLLAVAGITMLNESLDKEIATLKEIDKIFKANGI